jgi:5-methylcytosine-specific restriction protein B
MFHQWQKNGKLNYFRVFYPFFYTREEMKFTDDALQTILLQLVKDLELTDIITHAVNFSGPNHYGESRAWAAIYPDYWKSHQYACQLFFEIVPGESQAGLVGGFKLKEAQQKEVRDLDSYRYLISGLGYDKLLSIFRSRLSNYAATNRQIWDKRNTGKWFTEPYDETTTETDTPDDIWDDTKYISAPSKMNDILDAEEAAAAAEQKAHSDQKPLPGIRTLLKDVPATAPPAPYTRTQALQEIFMEEDRYDAITQTLLRKKNIVLQGPPGVGKTFMARRLAYALLGSKDAAKVCTVQFHQSYSYDDFIQGYRPDGNKGFAKRNGVFYEFCQKATHDPGSKYFFIIDEINRGNLSKIFGELLLLIEADKRGPAHAMPLIYAQPGEPDFFVPENVYLIGTMNTADRSLAMVDFALRRRFAFFDIEPQFGDDFFIYLSEAFPETFIQRLQQGIQALNNTIKTDPNFGKGYCIGHSYFTNLPSEGDDYNPSAIQWFKDILDHEIRPLLHEYWYDNPARVQQFLQQFVDAVEDRE